MPARLTPADRVTEVYHSQKILGRLADGVTLAQASSRARDRSPRDWPPNGSRIGELGGARRADRRADRARRSGPRCC